jgi:hypothetical protein
MIRWVLLLFLIAPLAWSADLTRTTTLFDVEAPARGPWVVYLFEMYDLKVPRELEGILLRSSKEQVVPGINPKYGFLQFPGHELPKKVYLASTRAIQSGAIPGAHSIAGNVHGFVEKDIQSHNQIARTLLSRLNPKTLVRVMAATLVRMELSTGDLVLVPNKGTWNKGRFQYPAATICASAVGGVAEADASKLQSLSGTLPGFSESSKLRLLRGITDGKTDLNLEFELGYWERFVSWFESGADRENDPTRELYEELVHENSIFTEAEWVKLGLRSPCSALMVKPVP